MLTGEDSDFVLNITTFYTGARWSEIMGLGPKFVSQSIVNIHWKLYELNGRFYRGRPKDGSIRDADIPPFLATLLEWQIDKHPNRKCTCRNESAPVVSGNGIRLPDARQRAHYRRSNYLASHRAARRRRMAPWKGRALRSATHAGAGRHERAVAGRASATVAARGVRDSPYEPPTGRGIRPAVRPGWVRPGRSVCARSTQLRQDGTLINHKTGPERCPRGSLLLAAALPVVADWLPLLAGLTEHGQRHRAT